MAEIIQENAAKKVAGLPSPGSATSSGEFTQIVVAVHGIGMQSRSATVQSVATRLARSKELLTGSAGFPVAPQPFGYFSSGVKNPTVVRAVTDLVHPVDDLTRLIPSPLSTVGVAEVFWSDIPQAVINDRRTLEETKEWARTVVARAKATFLEAKAKPRDDTLLPADFGLAGEVLEEIIQTVAILENLCFLSEKAGLFSFNLAELLEEYAGDVQLVTEFEYYRTDVVGRFHAVMESIYDQYIKNTPKDKKVEIHIVAHSEGTVVSLLGLMHAICKQRVVPAVPSTNEDATIYDVINFPAWLEHVAGFMTFGSPIDKHLLLWPRIWQEFNRSLASQANGTEICIRWRNYYDLADPIGFELDTARLWLKSIDCLAFEFCNCKNCRNDMGFARYLMPGLAHNEYWNDQEVFDHFIRTVIRPEHPPQFPPPKPPGNHWYAHWFSPWLLYVVCLVTLAAGVFLIFKAMQNYLHPAGDSFQADVHRKLFDPLPEEGLSKWEFSGAVAGITALMAGASLLGRVPRLARKWWWLVGVIAMPTGTFVYLYIVPQAVQQELSSLFYYFGSTAREWGILKWGIPVSAGVIGAWFGFMGGASKDGMADRREWRVYRGARPLMVAGAVLIIAVIGAQLRQPAQREYLNTPEWTRLSTEQSQDEKKQQELKKQQYQELQLILGAHLTTNELHSVTNTIRLAQLNAALPALQVNPPIWPLLLAGAAFLYLWWLSLLIFDLGFVWNRYVRRSGLNKRLQKWNLYGISPKKFEEEDKANKTFANCRTDAARAARGSQRPRRPRDKLT